MTNQPKLVGTRTEAGAISGGEPPGAQTAHRIGVGGRIQAQFDSQPGHSLLQAALNQGVPLPSSCRNGSCRACICRLVAGQIAYRIEWPGLLREEKAAGWILPCVAEACSDLLLHLPD